MGRSLHDAAILLGSLRPGRVVPWILRLLLRERFESWRHAPRVTAPTLIVAAAGDAVIPVEHARRLARSFAPARVRLTVLRGAG